jgi:DNA-binding NtrC family response regulator
MLARSTTWTISSCPASLTGDRRRGAHGGHAAAVAETHRQSEWPDHVTVGPWTLLPVVAELAERFAAREDAASDDGIRAGLRQLGQILRVDWAILRRESASGPIDPVSYSWHRSPDTPEPDESLLAHHTALAAASGNGGWHGPGAVEPDEGDGCGARADPGLCFLAAFPLRPQGDRMNERGVLAFGWFAADRHWSAVAAQLPIAAAVFGQVLASRDSRAAFARAVGAGPTLQPTGVQEAGPRQPEAADAPVAGQPRRVDDNYRRDAMQELVGSGGIIGQSPAIGRVLEQLRQVAATDSTVLLLGETGTGKELLATHLHELSARRGRAMVRVNCAAIPATLIESELFGREKGAFTGSLSRQIGRFESADRSTIFLDEIGDLPGEVQVKLLRVLEERRIERLGSPKSLSVDVRIIAATHRDLERRIATGAFREDLFYRLNVFPIHIPALRDRAEDIPLLVWRFVIEFSRAFGKRIDSIARASMATLQQYHWPGNIRELRNVVERAMIVAAGPALTIPLPATTVPSTGPLSVRLEDVEREHIRNVLERVRWRIRGMGGAADQLGLRPTTLETRMAKLGLARPRTA